MANDPYWNSVVLAMHMDDTGLTDMKGHAVTLAGNAVRSATQSKFGGYSAYFDGTGDYLTTPVSTDFNFGTGAFTIEFFLRFSVVATAGLVAFGPSGSVPILIYCVGTELRFYASSVATWDVASAVVFKTEPVAETWYHVAISRSGSSIRCFCDGVIGATVTSSASLAGAITAIHVGDWAAGNYLNGYIDDLRITKGVARYTANFTVPTTAFPDTPPQLSGTVKDASGNFASRPVAAYKRGTMALASAGISDATTGAFTLPAYDGTPHSVVALPVEGDPYWDRTVLAMHMDGANGSTTFTDEKGHTVTPTTTVLSTADKKFGTASLYYDGVAAGNVITASSADFALGGDFTIEGWFKPATDCPACYALSSNTSFAANTWILEPTHATNPGKWCFFMHGIAVTGGPLVSVSNSLTNQWTHVAITKQGAVYRMFINGVLEAMYVNAAAMSANASDAIYINGAAAGIYKGYIDDLRITKGVARYIHDFTPPSSPFPHAIAGGTENAIILDNITPV